jgi:WD40 repeat protein
MVILHALTSACHSVNSVAFSPDGELIASGSQDNTMNIWDAKTGTLQSMSTEHSKGYVFPLIFFALVVSSANCCHVCCYGLLLWSSVAMVEC